MLEYLENRYQSIGGSEVLGATQKRSNPSRV